MNIIKWFKDFFTLTTPMLNNELKDLLSDSNIANEVINEVEHEKYCKKNNIKYNGLINRID